jgi:hypothetical protein
LKRKIYRFKNIKMKRIERLKPEYTPCKKRGRITRRRVTLTGVLDDVVAETLFSFLTIKEWIETLQFVDRQFHARVESLLQMPFYRSKTERLLGYTKGLYKRLESFVSAYYTVESPFPNYKSFITHMGIAPSCYHILTVKKGVRSLNKHHVKWTLFWYSDEGDLLDKTIGENIIVRQCAYKTSWNLIGLTADNHLITYTNKAKKRSSLIGYITYKQYCETQANDTPIERDDIVPLEFYGRFQDVFKRMCIYPEPLYDL